MFAHNKLQWQIELPNFTRTAAPIAPPSDGALQNLKPGAVQLKKKKKKLFTISTFLLEVYKSCKATNSRGKVTGLHTRNGEHAARMVK